MQAHSKRVQWLSQYTVLRSSPRPLSFTMWWSQSYQGQRSNGVRENTKALHDGRALKIHYPLTMSNNNLCEHFLLNVMFYWWGSRGVQGQQQDSCPSTAGRRSVWRGKTGALKEQFSFLGKCLFGFRLSAAKELSLISMEVLSLYMCMWHITSY